MNDRDDSDAEQLDSVSAVQGFHEILLPLAKSLCRRCFASFRSRLYLTSSCDFRRLAQIMEWTSPVTLKPYAATSIQTTLVSARYKPESKSSLRLAVALAAHSGSSPLADPSQCARLLRCATAGDFISGPPGNSLRSRPCSNCVSHYHPQPHPMTGLSCLPGASKAAIGSQCKEHNMA